ncbi:LysR substrate-binding domain-containing protein, partial [Corynebacterium sp. 35RC1]|nr:LysR substrate-binding domain-containing protein [Corynebacterium sp. 35RC1]
MGNIPFVFAVAAHHPLAQMEEPLPAAAITRHRIVAVGDTSRNLPARTIGVMAGQDTLVVPSMTDKVQAQIRGLGCGWLPVPLAQPYLDSGVLIAKETTEDKRAATFQVAWRNNMRGKALQWWVDKLEDPRLPLLMAAPPRRPNAPDDLQTFVYAEPAPGSIFLWESWLRHEVTPHAGKGERCLL